jgi:sugar-specific transcriptional regulator TrmB
MSTPTSDLHELLRTLGFSQHEARAYEALLGHDGATAYEIAQRAGLPRANTYTVLESLARKGAVQQVGADPVRYVAVNPDEFFGRLASETRAAAERAAQLARQTPRGNDDVHVWTYRGEAAVRTKLADMIASAREHVWIKAPVNLILPHKADLWAAAARGTRVTLITLGDGRENLPAHRNITIMPHEGTGTIIGATAVLLTLTCDCENCMVATFGDAISGSFARNQSIVYVIETLILHEIFLAEIHAAMGPDLERHFGANLARLRERYRPAGMEHRLLAGAAALTQAAAATPASPRRRPRPSSK